MDEFTLYLYPEGGANSFHTTNTGNSEFRTVMARSPNPGGSPLSMRAKIVEVHHGKMMHQGKECFASLLVFEFRFQSALNSSRYRSVSIMLEFFDKEHKAWRNPVVVELSPDKQRRLNRTTVSKTVTKGMNATATAGVDIGGIDAGIKWEVQETKDVKYSARLTGTPCCSEGNSGEDNAVIWAMDENPSEGDGVPSFLQSAVLLKRSHQMPFTAKLRISSKVDWISAARRILPVATDKDKIIDPVTFAPGVSQVTCSTATGIMPDDLKSMDKLPVGTYFKVDLSEDDPSSPVEGTGSAPELNSDAKSTEAGKSVLVS
jgi:hypothetical protein